MVNYKQQQSLQWKLVNHWLQTQQKISILITVIILLSFSLLIFMFSQSFLKINYILPHTIPIFVAVLIGILSNRLPNQFGYIFFILCYVGIQLLLKLVNEIEDENFISCKQQNSTFNDSSYNVLYYIFGVIQMTIASSITNWMYKVVVIILFYESSIFIIGDFQIEAKMIALQCLTFFNKSKYGKLFNLQLTSYQTARNLQISSHQKQRYNIIFSGNQLQKYCKLEANQPQQINQNSQRGESISQPNILSQINISSIQIIKKVNQAGAYYWQNLDFVAQQDRGKKTVNIDQLIKHLYERSDSQQFFVLLFIFNDYFAQFLKLIQSQNLWELEIDKLYKTQEINEEKQSKYSLGKRYSRRINLKSKEFMICKFHIQVNIQTENSNLNGNNNLKLNQIKINNMNGEHAKPENIIKNGNEVQKGNGIQGQELKTYQGQIFQQKNIYTKEKYLTIFILDENQQQISQPQNIKKDTQINQIKQVITNSSVINELLNVPLKESVNEVLAKILLLQNNSNNNNSNNKYLQKKSSIANLDQSCTSPVNRISPFRLNSQKALPTTTKIENNLSILHQNVLYLQSIIQYQNSFIYSQILKQEIELKIQKFSLQEFLEEIKNIVMTQFYSQITNFIIDDQHINNQSPLSSSQSSPAKEPENSLFIQFIKKDYNKAFYVYTDFSVLKFMLLLLLEKVLKAERLEKQQMVILSVKEEGQNEIAFSIKFNEISKYISISQFINDSLIQLGSNQGFNQTWDKFDVEQIQSSQRIAVKRVNSLQNRHSSNFKNEIEQFRGIQMSHIQNKLELDKRFPDEKFTKNNRVNQIKFKIPSDLTKQTSNLDAIFINQLRQQKENGEPIPKQQDDTKDESKDLTFMTKVRQQNQHKNSKLEALAESLNFDQFDTLHSVNIEPSDIGDTEANLYQNTPKNTCQKPSHFSTYMPKLSLNRQNSDPPSQLPNNQYNRQQSDPPSQFSNYINQYNRQHSDPPSQFSNYINQYNRQHSDPPPNSSYRNYQKSNSLQKMTNTTTKTIFIINKFLQSKDQIQLTIQKKYQYFTNIYEFQSLSDCYEKLSKEQIIPDIFVLDANNFLNDQSIYFSKIYKFSIQNNKNQFLIYIFNENIEEEKQLCQIFKADLFSVVRYENIDNFLDPIIQ